MYDGLSKSDLRIILAHQELMVISSRVPTINRDGVLAACLVDAERFLASIEALSAEPESRRDDG